MSLFAEVAYVYFIYRYYSINIQFIHIFFTLCLKFSGYPLSST